MYGGPKGNFLSLHLSLTDDVRNHHSCAYYWRFRSIALLQGILDFLVLWQVLYITHSYTWFGEVDCLLNGGVVDLQAVFVSTCNRGFAALASDFMLALERPRIAPNSIPLVAIGTGLLWLGGMVSMPEANWQ